MASPPREKPIVPNLDEKPEKPKKKVDTVAKSIARNFVVTSPVRRRLLKAASSNPALMGSNNGDKKIVKLTKNLGIEKQKSQQTVQT